MTNVELYPEKPLRGRRITWAEFIKLTGRPRPDYQALAANDNRASVVASSFQQRHQWQRSSQAK